MAARPTDGLCDSWLDLRWHLDPAAASHAGVRVHDVRLGNFDAEALRPTTAALRSLTAAAEDLDVDSLDEEIDRTALLETMRMQLQRYERERPQENNPAFWLTHLFDAFYALDRRTGPAGESAGVVLARLRAVPAYLDAAVATLAAPPLVLVDHALALLGGGGQLIAMLAARCSAADPAGAEAFTADATIALAALRAFGEHLSRGVEPDADPHAFALGEDNFGRRLHHEYALRSSAPELHRYALHARDELIHAIKREALEFDDRRSWQDVVAELASQRPVDGQVLDIVRRDVERAGEYVATRGIAVVPNERLDVAALPVHLRALGISAEYIAPEDGDDAAPGLLAIGDDPRLPLAAIPAVVARYGSPGRHLLEQHARRGASQIRRTLRSRAMTDGWSLYAADVMDEQAFILRPVDRLFRLVALLHAIVALEIDIGLHTRNLPRTEAIDLLCTHLPIERRIADAEVRRICAEPTSGLAAAAGRRELRSLSDAAKRDSGSQFNLGEFHASIFTYGALPPALIRWGMGYSE